MQSLVWVKPAGRKQPCRPWLLAFSPVWSVPFAQVWRNGSGFVLYLHDASAGKQRTEWLFEEEAVAAAETFWRDYKYQNTARQKDLTV